jgi:hypothetical protein
MLITYYLIPIAPKLLPKPFKQTLVLHGTFPSLHSQFSDNSEYSKTILNHHQTLKCIILRFGNTPDITKTPHR